MNSKNHAAGWMPQNGGRGSSGLAQDRPGSLRSDLEKKQQKVLVCSCCKTYVNRKGFAGSQWKTARHKRRCKRCASNRRQELTDRRTGCLPKLPKRKNDPALRLKDAWQNPKKNDPALLVKEPFASRIIEKLKTLDVRGRSTNKRERVWVVSLEKGRILGSVEIAGCKRYTREEIYTLQDRHTISKQDLHAFAYAKYFGYELKNPVALRTAYFHRKYAGPMTWARIRI